jgi:hypothetical protein
MLKLGHSMLITTFQDYTQCTYKVQLGLGLDDFLLQGREWVTKGTLNR